ncbi:unnamed protein product [Echinostoma caproni]|uniref:Cadherin domain-containing protein n=1 Tax=Echinostoma caproni TaxID=27848 RepID=A0A183AGG6_9TREM|nr:unnamed protein product [Echinostoma caproni]
MWPSPVWTNSIVAGFVNFLYLSILIHTPPVVISTRYRPNPSSMHADLTRPVRFTVSISESDIADQTVANLTALLWASTEIPTRMSTELHTQRVRPKYELLDVSANLLANLPPQRHVNFVQLVQLDSQTGVVRFTVPLDRERLCPDAMGTEQKCTISLLIAIHLSPTNDSQLSAQTIYADLTVLVIDVNDNAPYFTVINSADSAPLAVLTVDEECPIGTMIQLPQATDPDALEHGVQRYEFHPTTTPARVREYFDIVQFRHQPGLRCEDVTPVQLELVNGRGPADSRPMVACLRTIKRLDRETVGDQFHFRLVAFDSDEKRGEIAVQLLVRDVNDHAPEWASKLERFDSTGRSLWVSASPTDPPQPSETRQTHYAFSVPECTTQHKLVRLEARDQDDAQQNAGKITFRLSEHSPDSQTNTLRRRIFISNNHLYLTDRGLRGLVQPNLTVVVIASDGAGKSTEAWFHLRIEDCNDHRPMILIQNTDYISIPEESTGQSHLISLITVRDFDLVTSPNSKFTCFLNDTTYLELKEVVTGPTADDSTPSEATHLRDDESAGDESVDLTARRGRWSVYRLGSRPEIAFDREAGAVYTVLLECVDKGIPALTATRLITIHVEDINDNAPQFITRCSPYLQNLGTVERQQQQLDRDCPAQFEFTVYEDAERGVLIGSVRAMDLDSGENARLVYSLHPLHPSSNPTNSNESESFRPESLFAVSPMGELHLIGELDRESQNRYEFLVQATDHGKTRQLSSTATVTILVGDVNDCAPIFQGEYVFEHPSSYFGLLARLRVRTSAHPNSGGKRDGEF